MMYDVWYNGNPQWGRIPGYNEQAYRHPQPNRYYGFPQFDYNQRNFRDHRGRRSR